MSNVNFEERAMYVMRSATDTGSDAHQTTPIQEVEQNLEAHVDTELDVIWEEQGTKTDEEWERIREGIIEEIPNALEKIQEETDLDFYEKRVREQFEQLN